MQLKGQRRINAAPDAVFAALIDPEVLKACIPGCKEMTGSLENGFDAVVVQNVGPVKATFRGHVELENLIAPERLTISGEGRGGPAGFAKGGADVTLSAQDGGTLLEYDVQAKVGGKLAQLGSRIIDGFAKKMADQFFSLFKEAVEAAAVANVDRSDEEIVEVKKKGWLKRLFSG